MIFFQSVIADHVPKRVILIRSRDKPWFDAECCRAYELKQRVFSAWRRLRSNEAFGQFRGAQRNAKSVYIAAQRNFVAGIRDTLAFADCAHK